MDEFNKIQIQELKKDIEILLVKYQANKEQIREGIDYEQQAILENRLNHIIADINSKKDEIRKLESTSQNELDTSSSNQFDENYFILKDLKDQLMNLNYHDQTRPFEDFWISENNLSFGSFLIHGERKGCHKWLVNQLLIQGFPDDTTTSKKLIITVERETYIDELWKKMSRTFLSTSSSATPKQLVQSVYKHWQTKTVILVFYHLEKLDKTEPKKLIEQFWHPLVELIQKHPEDCYSYLAMFLINHTSSSNEWDIDCLETLDTEHIDTPIMLKPIENFSKILIRNWINKNWRKFPKLIAEVAEIDPITKDIWEDSFQGMPELAIEKICNRCGTSFYDISKLLEI